MLIASWSGSDAGRRRMSQLVQIKGQKKPDNLPNRREALKRAMTNTLARTTERLLPAYLTSRLRTKREWKQWIESLTPELLDDLSAAPIEVKRSLFRKNVTLVEIETHAMCNRICSFCPNVIEDRRRNNTLADADLLDSVFDELGSIDYARQIKVARYSEPLTNIEYLYGRLASARERVPRSQLAIVTNTDYLTPAILAQLRDIGLNVVYMSLYLKSKEKWSLDLAHAYSERLAKKLGIRMKTRKESLVSLQCTFKYDGLELYSACMNFDEYGTDRGGVIDQYIRQQRLSPCREPFQTFVIDYTGSVSPCCCLRSDLPQHDDLMVGDLSVPGTSIFDIYAGRLSVWRRKLVGFDAKESPCATCRHRAIPDSLIQPISNRLEKQLNHIDRSQYYRSHNSY